MSACLWVHRRNLVGRITERCARHGHARVPRLSAAEAMANMRVLLNEQFKRAYQPLLLSAMPPESGLLEAVGV
jgi:hypothetical protein